MTYRTSLEEADLTRVRSRVEPAVPHVLIDGGSPRLLLGLASERIYASVNYRFSPSAVDRPGEMIRPRLGGVASSVT